MEEHDLAIPFDIEELHESLIHKLHRKVQALAKNFLIRIIDIVFSLIGIVCLIPLSFVVFFQNVKNKDYGKLFYTQERIGKNGKIFKMYKFRTMVNEADQMLEAMLQNKENKKEYEKYRKFVNDPRLTKFGKKLRATSLDEFPQFINILKGEMTLVGPRPYLPEEKERMGTYYKYIIQHKPGLTGVYQIAGKARVEFEDRLDMDYRYHYNKRFGTDVKIALVTMLITLRRKQTFGSIGELVQDTSNYIFRLINLFLKRVIDIVGAFVGIAILIPLTVGVKIANMISGDFGPLFYSHTRVGKDGKHFKMYKFRSMCVDSDKKLKELLENDENARKEWEENQKLQNDPRITKVGKILRKTSLDEFPQFVNVLKGDMSLVGPRAIVDDEIEKFGNLFEKAFSVKPGITGYWAANGRSNTTYQERIEMEATYVDEFSVMTDIVLLFKTVISVVKREGAV